ncbi:MAG: hypothetical protein QOG04_348 [Actinomycetota bacterium]|jgi:uncharacterized repeat protein (TIGR03847 family)|nr:hypothetical protein [Actinomycetota bacterium]
MSELEQSPEIFTADYMGEPGKRTFFIQSQDDETTLSFLVEKQQVAVLAERMRDVLLMIDETDTIKSAPPARDPGLNAAQPVEPEWRVGNMGLAYDEETDRVVVLLEEAQTEEDEPDLEAGAARMMLRRDQARSFILHAIAIVDEGRPICQLCGLPMDPAGHKCPASNGHHAEAPSGL